MRILKTIWADILYINSQLELAVKVFGLIIGTALIVASWYIGKDWWNQSVNIMRLVIAVGLGATVVACYVVTVIIRSRRPFANSRRFEARRGRDEGQLLFSDES